MKQLILYYSYKGNNRALASILSEKLNCACEEIIEKKRRSIFTFIKELITKKTPSLKPLANDVGAFDRIILLAPYWMGRPASPCVSIMTAYNEKIHHYAFVTVCGGSVDGYNKGESFLRNKLQGTLDAFFELKLNNIVPPEIKNQPQKIMKLSFSKDDIAHTFAADIAEIVKKLS